MLLAVALVLVCCASSSLAQTCKNAGCLQGGGFTLIYVRDGDYVNITAYVQTPVDTWLATGISADMMMPATDSVVGAVSSDGTQSFVDDRYNPNRMMPVYDAQQDISNESVERVNGYTVMSFTRPIASNDTTQDITLDQCRWALWANGGTVSNYGTEATGATFDGHSAKGVFAEQICLCADDDETNSEASIDAVFEQCPLPGDLPACKNAGCLQGGGFSLIYVRDGDNVNITAFVQTPDDTWLGTGISADMLMPITDSVIGARSSDGTQYFVNDRYNPNRMRPVYDAQQDISNESVERVNGYTVMSFTRPIASNDTTQDITLDLCRWALWANGGTISDYGNSTSGAIFGGHSAKGVFAEQICLCANMRTASEENVNAAYEQCPLPKAPPTCKNYGCLQDDDTDYTFIYVRYDDYVSMTAIAKTDTWVGVGISNDKLMPNSDTAIGARSTDGNQYFLDDRFNEGRVMPRIDGEQNLSNKQVVTINGYTAISFNRPITSPDTSGDDINLDEARYVIWAYGGNITSFGDDRTSATFKGHGGNKGVFADKIYLCDDDDRDTTFEEKVRKATEQCPMQISDEDVRTLVNSLPTDAAGHITVSLISLVVIVLMTVFAVGF